MVVENGQAEVGFAASWYLSLAVQVPIGAGQLLHKVCPTPQKHLIHNLQAA